MRKWLCLLLVLLSTSCGETARENYQTDLNSLLDADRQASKIAQQQGMNTAMLQNIDSNIVLLSSGRRPLKAGEAISFLQHRSDTSAIITWEPVDGFVAASGELGYTYGIYTVIGKSDNRIRIQGTYTTVWKRHHNGQWKMLLDTGTEGLQPDSTKK